MNTLTGKACKRFLSIFTIISMLIGMAIPAFAQDGEVSQQSAPLRERGMVEKVLVDSQASILDSSWIQIYLRENEYNATNVSNAGNYQITSSDDPDFAVPVSPILVNHRYFQEDGPYSDTIGGGNIAKLNVIYRIFLQLPISKQFKEGKTYTVTVNEAVVNVAPITTKFDLAVPNEVIHVNQVGYITDGPKVAYLSWWTGQGSISFANATDFYLIDESTGKAVYTGDVQFVKAGAEEKWGKSDLYSMDFTSFKPEGRYHLYIPGVGSSYSFKIGSAIYMDQIGYTLMRGMTMQRDGDHGLDDPNVTHWNRPAAHLDDAIEESTGLHVDLTGGHMDAGDRGKYPYNVASMSANMLSTAALFPNQIKALGESLQIPESTNGIPDYLDELVYELDFLRKAVMNTSKDGALAEWIHPSNDGYEAGYPLEGATGRVYFDESHGPKRQETLYGAAALAMAYNSPLLQEYFPERMEGYRAAALRAFGAFETHNDEGANFWLEKEGLEANPQDEDAASAGVPHFWSDEMLIAAAQLHQMTGDVKYLAWINSEMPTKQLGSEQKQWGWVNEGAWPIAFLSLSQDMNLTEEVRQNARNAIVDWADHAMAPSREQPYGVPMVDDTYNRVGWYFSGSNVGYPMMMAYGISGDPKYRDQLVKTWNYLLGSNPLSNSYISGLGDPQRSPHFLTHEISQYQWAQYKAGNGGWNEMVPGIPNADLQEGKMPTYLNDAWNSERTNKRYPALDEYPALYRYTDTWNVTNEFITVWLTRGASSIVPLIPTELYTLNATADHGTITPSSGAYSKGTILTLTVTPDLGYKFTGWSGDAAGADESVTITMDANKTIAANFEPTPTYELNIDATNGSVVLDPPGGVYNEGTSVTVKAVPESAHRFAGWSGDLTGAENPAVIVMDNNKTVTATFEDAPTHTLSINGDNGQVLYSPQKTVYEDGESVMLQALPNSGYRFVGWSGGLESTLNPASLIMDADKTVTANFQEIPRYDVILNATQGGSVAPATGSFAEGTQITLNATPQRGYVFTGWSGDLTGITNPVDVVIDGPKNITANFQSKYGIISRDITTNVAGSTTVENDVYTIVGSGENVWAAPDGFRYVHEMGLKDNFSLVAKLDSMTVENSNGMAGIMIRTSTEANAAYSAIFVQNGELVGRWRKGGEYSDEMKREAVTLPVWMKVERGPSPWNITTYTSNDGQNWTEFTKSDFWAWMDTNLELTSGLFVNSGGPDQWPKYTTAQFSNVAWPRDPNVALIPEITLDQTDTTVIREEFTVSGSVTNAEEVKVKAGDGPEQTVPVTAGVFSTTVNLVPGENIIAVSASEDAEPVQIRIVYNQPPQAVSQWAASAPNIDGIIDDSAWNHQIINTVNRSIYNGEITADSDNTIKYGLLWDDQYLYVGAEVTDANVFPGENAYSNDGLEIYVDMKNEKNTSYGNDDSQLMIGPGHSFITSWRPSEGVVGNSVITDTGYTVEMKIPWSTFGVTPSADMKIGFDIGLNDDDTGEGRTGVLMWSGTMNNWTDTSSFGEAQLQLPKTVAGQTSVLPIVDGDIGDSVWSNVISNEVTRSIYNNEITAPSDNVVKYGLLWDDQYLYVGAEVTDANVFPGADAYSNDGLEIYVDMKNDKSTSYGSDDSQLMIGPGHAFITSWRPSEGVIGKSVITETGYTVEMKIPWSTFGVTPSADMVIGFDIGLNDDDTGEGRTGVLMANGTMNNWGDTSKFGVAQLQRLQTAALQTSAAPDVDGDIADSVWSNVIANAVTRSIYNNEITAPSDNEVKYGLLWDDQYLYVGAEVTDANVFPGTDAYSNDGLEIYVDMKNEKSASYGSDDSQLMIGPGHSFITSWRPSEGVVGKSVITETGYTVEMKIPWSTFGVTPTEDMVIGFDIGINDDDTGEGRTGVLMASGTMDNWGNTSKFAEAVLSGAADPVEPQAPFVVGAPVFTNFAGVPVTALTPSGFLKSSVNVTNQSNESKQATLIVALYNASGSVLNLSYVDQIVGAGQTQTLNAGFSLPANVEGAYVRVFVWNSFSGMEPLSDAVTFPNLLP